MTTSNVVLEALIEAVKVIEDASLDYCLFGGLAIQAYKRIRSTMDVDFMITIDEAKRNDFIAKLQKNRFEFNTKNGIVKIGDFEFLRCVYTDKKYQIDVFVDFVTVKTDFQKQILRRKQRLNIFGLKINIASCEDLILLKVLSGRPLDLSDADVLIAENITSLDREYLKESANKMGIERRMNYMMRYLAATRRSPS